MKVKFANRIYEVLFTKELAGLTMYAVEDEPNHIDWLINVEVIDAEKKEIESFDEYEGLTDFERTLADICIGWIGKEIGWKQYIKDNADVLLKIAVEKFNSVQDVPFEQKPTDEEMKEALKTEYEKGRADAIAEMQNPAWGEEDEIIYQSIMDDTVQENQLDGKQIDWLRDIKYRYFPQPKSAWSEEDEHRIKDTVYFLDTAKKHYASTEELDACIDWVKSLRPQNRWKPSDEQIKVLEHFVRSIGESGYASPYENNTKLLYSLLNDLKKLTE